MRNFLYTLFSGLFLIMNVHPSTVIVDGFNSPSNLDDRPRLELAESDTKEIASTHQTSMPVYSYTPTVTTASVSAPINSVSFAGRTIPIFYSSDTLTDSGNQVGLYNGKFLYGHNSANVFGNLPNLGLGANVTITLNGQSTTYTIAHQITMTKEQTQGYMRAISNARISGVQYAYSMMTCAGTSYGNGDASHRTIIFLK